MEKITLNSLSQEVQLNRQDINKLNEKLEADKNTVLSLIEVCRAGLKNHTKLIENLEKQVKEIKIKLGILCGCLVVCLVLLIINLVQYGL